MAGGADARRLMVALVASALVLAYVFFSSAEFRQASLIYFSMFTITLLVVLNPAFFKKYWYVGLGLFIFDWVLINNSSFQVAYLSLVSLLLLASYFFIVPKAWKVVA